MGKTSCFHCHGPMFDCWLVGLRFHKPWDSGKKEKKKKNQKLWDSYKRSNTCVMKIPNGRKRQRRRRDFGRKNGWEFSKINDRLSLPPASKLWVPQGQESVSLQMTITKMFRMTFMKCFLKVTCIHTAFHFQLQHMKTSGGIISSLSGRPSWRNYKS